MLLLLLAASAAASTPTTLFAAVDDHIPGPGPPAARLWARYLPHLVTREHFGRNHSPETFVEDIREIGVALGFNVSSTSCAYDGPGAHDELGPLFVDGPWWSDRHPRWVMRRTPPHPRDAVLTAVDVKNVDVGRNMLCPCGDREECVETPDVMPRYCVPRVAEAVDDNELLLNIAVLIALTGGVLVATV